MIEKGKSDRERERNGNKEKRNTRYLFWVAQHCHSLKSNILSCFFVVLLLILALGEMHKSQRCVSMTAPSLASLSAIETTD